MSIFINEIERVCNSMYYFDIHFLKITNLLITCSQHNQIQCLLNIYVMGSTESNNSKVLNYHMLFRNPKSAVVCNLLCDFQFYEIPRQTELLEGLEVCHILQSWDIFIMPLGSKYGDLQQFPNKYGRNFFFENYNFYCSKSGLKIFKSFS